MAHEPQNNEPVFTKKGAILGFISYVVVALIVYFVFAR